MDMPAKRSAFVINIAPEVLLGRNGVFIIYTNGPYYFTTKQPQIVHVVPDGLLLQPPVDHAHHERPHDAEYVLSVRNIFWHEVPTVRPFRKIWADVFGCLHILIGQRSE
jgi:hypothetical protein